MKLLASILLGVLFIGCQKIDHSPTNDPQAAYELALPPGFLPPAIPEDNALTVGRVALGKRLFFDAQLSVDKTLSCASCHLPERAFTETNPISIGVNNAVGLRNAPSLANVVYQKALFAEGGVPSLELQAIAPLTEAHEMNIDLETLLERLSADGSYVEQFREAYNTDPNTASLVKALASFQRTLISGNSRFDQYHYQGNNYALNASEIRGMDLFFSEEVGCDNCHSGFLFTDQTFQNIGLYDEYADEGRARLTEQPEDIGKFKVPSLRNIEVTAPYMHNGSMATLEEVVAHFNAGGSGHPNKSEYVKSLELTDSEQQDLVHFLMTLTDESFLNNPDYK